MTQSSAPARTAEDTVLRVENVSKRFASEAGARRFVDALDNVSLAVTPEEAVGLIGPNGAGKSTLLKLIAGVTAPTSGTITRTPRVTTVIELGSGLHPDLSGRESIDLLARLAGAREMRSGPLFDEVVEFSGLGDVIDRRVRSYSTGMIARLSFSVAAHLPADLLLVDEVLSVGDSAFQQLCQDRIFEVRRLGTAVVVVSHDLELVARTCDRALLLDHGRVEVDGPSDAAIRRYRGESEPVSDNHDLGLVLLSPTTLASGSTLIAELTSDGAASAEVQFTIPNHFGLESTHGSTLVCGSATTTLETSGRHRLSIPTEGLPPDRYQLRVGLRRLDRPDHVVVQAVPFALTGPPGPKAIRLRSTVGVQALNEIDRMDAT